MTASICFLNRHNTENDSFKLHSHDCYEIVYFLSGNGNTVIENKSFDIKADCCCLVSPGSRHIEHINGYGEILFIGFKYSGSLLLREGVYWGDSGRRLKLFREIFSEYKTQRYGFETAAGSLLNLLLVSLGRENSGGSVCCKDLNYIRSYIEQHFDQKISFKELSSLTAYSYDYFRHIFKERFNVSPQEYLIYIRLKNAERLLRSSDLSCTEIAYRCGFSGSGQFSAMFKKRYGISPSEHRITDLCK